MKSALAVIVALAGSALPAQVIYVADDSTQMIRQVSSTGVVTTFITGTSPTWMATDAAGNLFYTSPGGNVFKVDPSGSSSVFASIGTVNNPTGIAIASNGSVFVARNSASSITEFSSTGTVLATHDFSAYSFIPESMAFGDGYLYLMNSSYTTVLKMDLAGNISTFATGSFGAYNNATLAFSGGSLFTTGLTDSILKFDANGVSTEFASLTNGLVAQPWGIAADGNGGLFAVGAQNNSLYRIDATGSVSLFAALGADAASFVAVSNLSAIPEPSTYAAIFGGVALAGAIWWRRREAKSIRAHN